MNEIVACPKCGNKHTPTIVDNGEKIATNFKIVCSECGLETSWYWVKGDAITAWSDMNKMKGEFDERN